MKRWRRLLRHRRAVFTGFIADICVSFGCTRVGSSLDRRSANITIFEGE